VAQNLLDQAEHEKNHYLQKLKEKKHKIKEVEEKYQFER
jgi:hypothetical protein